MKFSRLKMLGLGASKGWGHVASALSMHSYLRHLLPQLKTNYEMVIGKPFGAQAYYSIWHEMGLMTDNQLDQAKCYIDQNDLPFVHYSEPTLGNALGVAIGRAIGSNKDKPVWCNISDGALSMGPTLEAIISMDNLRQHMKNNLLLTIDFNHHTTLDENIVSKEAMIQLFRSHHWHVTEINVEVSSQRYISSQIENVLSQNRMVNGWANVQVIIFVTEKGDGVDEIQNDLVTYHAKPVSIAELNYMNIKEYEDA